MNVKEDRRHDRRTLAVDELRRLIDTAHRGPDYRKMTGPTRALCYRLAVATGLRFAEIASITADSFDLDGDRPTVSVTAGYTKNGEPATLPLPADLAATLAGFIAPIPRGVPAFPLPDRGAAMLRRDLDAAGIPYRDEAGQVFDFHSLRCQCATLADQAGVSPRVVQRMMRHSTLELTGRYTRPRVADLERAADALPNLAPRTSTAEPMAATGTDPVPSATASATDSDDDGPKPMLFMVDASNDPRNHNPRVGGSNPSAATREVKSPPPGWPKGGDHADDHPGCPRSPTRSLRTSDHARGVGPSQRRRDRPPGRLGGRHRFRTRPARDDGRAASSIRAGPDRFSSSGDPPLNDPSDCLILLDSEPLGLVSNPRDSEKATRCKAWLRGLLAGGFRVTVPEVIDYEVRRGLIRAGRTRGLQTLDAIGRELGLLPCSGAVLVEAAGLWAKARLGGLPTAEDKALDIDVILGATANLAAGDGLEVVIATGNVAQLSRYAPAELWSLISP